MKFEWLDFYSYYIKVVMRSLIVLIFMTVAISYSTRSFSQVDSAKLAKTEKSIERNKKDVKEMDNKIEKQENKIKRKERKAQRTERKREKEMKRIRKQEREVEKIKEGRK